MKYSLMFVLGIVLLIIAIILCKKIIKSVIIKVLIVISAIFFFIGGCQVLNLNVLSPDVKSKVDSVVDSLGSSTIRTEGNKVLLKINDSWYDISKLSIIGKTATEDIKLRYEGKDIVVCQSGVVNAVKVLEGIGLLRKDNS